MVDTSVWGSASFDNQAASTWIEAFAEGPTDSGLEAALRGWPADQRIEAARIAIAAAEAVAAWRGAASPELPASLGRFTFGRSEALPPDLLRRARRTVAAIRDVSALRDHWRARGRLQDFEGRMDDLVARLGGAVA